MAGQKDALSESLDSTHEMNPHSDLLARVNFPLYSVRMLTSRHILVAGGGGSSRAGVPNGFEIFELSHDGHHCHAMPLTYFDTHDNSIMNCTSFPDKDEWILLTGQEENCQTYKLKLKVLRPEEEGEIIDGTGPQKGNIRRRRRTGSTCVEDLDIEDNKTESNKKSESHKNGVVKKISFDIQPLASFQTDFSKEESPLQRVVRVSWDRSTIITGGVDGCVRLWKYPGFQKMGQIKAHNKEIDDLDISPSGNHLVTISKDGNGFIWTVKDRKKKCQLEWDPPPGGFKYLFKRCRYGIVENDLQKSRLFTIHNPVGTTKKPSFIVQWETSGYQINRQVSRQDTLSALAVSGDGKFLAVGSMFDGSVFMYVAFSLQPLKQIKETHRSFVTGLEFIPATEEGERVTGYQEASLLSISVDNQIQIHHIPRPIMLPSWVLLLLSVIVLIITFLVASWVGL